jgi:hypothetical protein
MNLRDGISAALDSFQEFTKDELAALQKKHYTELRSLGIPEERAHFLAETFAAPWRSETTKDAP